MGLHTTTHHDQPSSTTTTLQSPTVGLNLEYKCLPLIILPFMPVTSIFLQAFSSISSNASLLTTMSSIFPSKSYLVSLVTILDINGLTEVEENDSNDTLECDDDAHKVILCNQSLILYVWLLFWMKIMLLRLK